MQKLPIGTKVKYQHPWENMKSVGTIIGYSTYFDIPHYILKETILPVCFEICEIYE